MEAQADGDIVDEEEMRTVDDLPLRPSSSSNIPPGLAGKQCPHIGQDGNQCLGQLTNRWVHLRLINFCLCKMLTAFVPLLASPGSFFLPSFS